MKTQSFNADSIKGTLKDLLLAVLINIKKLVYKTIIILISVPDFVELLATKRCEPQNLLHLLHTSFQYQMQLTATLFLCHGKKD